MRNHFGETEPSIKEYGDVTIDVEARLVAVAGREVHLTRTEFDLLRTFIEHPRRALSRTDLIRLVWGEGWFGDDHLVSVHIANLRRKLDDGVRHPRLISTIHGFGYRFDGVEGTATDTYSRLRRLEAG